MRTSNRNQNPLHNGSIALYFLIFLSVLLAPMCAVSYEWELLGPENQCIYQYSVSVQTPYMDILCGQEGLFVWEESGWTSYNVVTNDFPCWDAMDFNQDTLITIMGNGSWSDAAYLFDCVNHTFTVTEYAPWPTFLQKWGDTFYLGYRYGIFTSTDGRNWTPIDHFTNENCEAMLAFGSTILVSVITENGNANGVHYSHDGGGTWNSPTNPTPIISEFTLAENNRVYGIFPDASNSSGLWMSDDHGINWQVQCYSDNCTSLYNAYNRILAGWSGGGVAIWNTEENNWFSINEGLPCLMVNGIRENPLIDCENCAVATDEGLYMLYQLPIVESPEPSEAPHPVSLALNCYPNPFNQSTNVVFTLPYSSPVEIMLFDRLGRSVSTLSHGYFPSGSHRFSYDAGHLTSGTYFIRIQAGDLQKTIRTALIK